MLIDGYFQWGLSSDEAMDFITPAITICTLLIIMPKLRSNFNKWFILNKNELYKIICYPVLISIVISFLAYTYTYTLYWFGNDPVQVGSNQVTTIEGVSKIGLKIVTVIIAPFTEEFIFRYGLFALLIMMLTKLRTQFKWAGNLYNHLLMSKTVPYLLSWAILINIIFSLAHGPDLSSFPLYFVTGVVNTLFYFRSGFIAAWISHGMFNFLSPLMNSIFINLLF